MRQVVGCLLLGDVLGPSLENLILLATDVERMLDYIIKVLYLCLKMHMAPLKTSSHNPLKHTAYIQPLSETARINTNFTYLLV